MATWNSLTAAARSSIATTTPMPGRGTRDAQIVFEAAASGTYYLNASGVGVNTVTYTLLATQGAAAAPSTQTAQAAKADAFSFKTSGFTVEEMETTRGNRDASAPASPWDAMAGSQFGEDIMGGANTAERL